MDLTKRDFLTSTSLVALSGFLAGCPGVVVPWLFRFTATRVYMMTTTAYARAVAEATATRSLASALAQTSRTSLIGQRVTLEVGPGLPMLLGMGVVAISPSAAEAARSFGAQAILVRDPAVSNKLHIQCVQAGNRQELFNLTYTVRDAKTSNVEVEGWNRERGVRNVALPPGMPIPSELLSLDLSDLPKLGEKTIEGLALNVRTMKRLERVTFQGPLKALVVDPGEVFAASP